MKIENKKILVTGARLKKNTEVSLRILFNRGVIIPELLIDGDSEQEGIRFGAFHGSELHGQLVMKMGEFFDELRTGNLETLVKIIVTRNVRQIRFDVNFENTECTLWFKGLRERKKIVSEDSSIRKFFNPLIR